MSTTSLKLPPKLKQMATSAAADRGVSTHAFMVEAIEKLAVAHQQESVFARDAKRAYDETVKSRNVYEGASVLAYFKKKAAGKKANRPAAVTWRS